MVEIKHILKSGNYVFYVLVSSVLGKSWKCCYNPFSEKHKDLYCLTTVETLTAWIKLFNNNVHGNMYVKNKLIVHELSVLWMITYSISVYNGWKLF